MKRIPLTRGKFALVDDEDYVEINSYKWFARKEKTSWYAERCDARKTVTMQQRIMGQNSCGKLIDHKDLNGLNNQRGNLRWCTVSQNAHNSRIRKDNKSGYKGVSWNKGSKKWQANIKVDMKDMHLGLFFCIVKAARAYDTAARKYFGEFARTNF